MDKTMTREFKKPDLNAPRCRKSIPKLLTNDFLKEFQEKHPQYKDFSLETARSIANTFHGKLWDHAVFNRDGVELPEGLGFLFIGTCSSPKKYNMDYSASAKHEAIVRHRNFESDNYLAKIFYTNFASKYKFRNREMWTFTATREFKRSVAKEYPQNWKLYVQVEAHKNISRYMRQSSLKTFFKKQAERYVADPSYNEFDLN
jgi:hypothetical protein